MSTGVIIAIIAGAVCIAALIGFGVWYGVTKRSSEEPETVLDDVELTKIGTVSPNPPTMGAPEVTEADADAAPQKEPTCVINGVAIYEDTSDAEVDKMRGV